MTGLVESTAAEAAPVRRDSRFAAIGGWRGIGWLFCGVGGALAVVWFILLSPGETGPKAEWFFGSSVLCVALVVLWQTVNVQRQANRRADEAAERLRVELAAAQRRFDRERAAADERAARERELAQTLHKAELETQQKSHRAEMNAHRQQAETERRHLLNQLQKQAVSEVSRAVSEQTQMLAGLWNRGVGILHSADRDERERAMLPIFEQIGQVVNDFSVELANAHQIVDDARLSQALEAVNEAVLMGIRVAQEVCDGIVDGKAPQRNPVPPVQRLMTERAAEARRLAWQLLRTGL